MMAQIRSVSVVLGLVLVLAGAAPATADTAMHGRVSYESGGGMVKGNADSDWGYATVNTLVLPGDTLWADSGALMEVEFNGGSFLRMADQSKVDVVGLPPNAVFRGWSGSFYVHRVSRSSGDVVFQAPACHVSVERDTQARIDIVEEGATTVTVRWGRVTVVTDKGQPVVVSTGQRVFVDPGFLPSLPQRYDTSAEDDFDAWSRERARLVATGDKALPSSYRVTSTPLGTADLVNYGEWVTVDNTPYWRPTVVVDYVPYRQGIWSYTPSYGYVWVGDYPFSYVTSHYGRWTYHGTHGWLWCYQDVWAPAWVAPVRCGQYFAWAPLDPFGRPVTVGSVMYNFGSFSFSLGATSYCLADNLFYGYSYGRPATGSIFNNISGNNIYVWNITGNTININYPWAGNLPVRDYKPQRVIRGPESISTGSRVVRAAERATRLEAGVGRAGFAPVERAGGRGVRTASEGGAREARMRSVGVEPARALEGSRTSERVADAANASAGRATREGRSADNGTDRAVARAERDAGRGAGVDGVVERGERGSRTVTTDPNDGAAPDRTTRSISTERDRGVDRGEGRGVDRGEGRTIERGEGHIERSTPDRSVAPSEERGGRTIDVDRTDTRMRSERTTRTEPRTAGPRTINLNGGNGNGRSSAPAYRGEASRMPQTGNGTIERTAPQGGGRTIERTAPQGGGRGIERSAPVTRNIERSAPRSVERTAPPAPQRSIERAPQQPSRSMSYPRATDAGPRTVNIPRETSRSATLSAPAPQRRVEAPMPQRQIQAPAPQRQMQAPAPQRRVEMPAPRIERQSAPVAPQQRAIEMPRAVERPSMPQMQAPQQRMDMGGSRERVMSGGGGRGHSDRAVGQRSR